MTRCFALSIHIVGTVVVARKTGLFKGGRTATQPFLAKATIWVRNAMIARSAFFPAFVNVGKACGEKGCGGGERVVCCRAGSLGRERRGIDGQGPEDP